jgi:hypothetical protein
MGNALSVVNEVNAYESSDMGHVEVYERIILKWILKE